MRGLRAAAVLGALTAAILVPAAPATAAPLVVHDTALEKMFGAYGDAGTGDRWTGADGTYSLQLPGGNQRVWIFSDTFLGKVNADHSRDTQGFIHNSYVIQDSTGLTRTLFTRDAFFGDSAYINSSTPETWYWMGAAMAEGNTIKQFVHTFTGAGVVYQQTGGDVITISLPDYKIQSVTANPGPYAPTVQTNGGGPVQYGAAITPTTDYTYVWGVEDYLIDKFLHVARVPTGHLLDGTWEYFGSSGWSTNPVLSTRLIHSVSDELSIVKTSSGYRMVAQNDGIGVDIIMSTAPAPEGPWSAAESIYVTPENGGSTVTYNAKEHPELDAADHIVVSYNVNGSTTDSNSIFRNVDNYRPRFIDVYIPSGVMPAGPLRPAATVATTASRVVQVSANALPITATGIDRGAARTLTAGTLTLAAALALALPMFKDRRRRPLPRYTRQSVMDIARNRGQ